MIACQASGPEPVLVSRTTEREVTSPQKKDTGKPQQAFSVTILPVLPQSDLQPFTYSGHHPVEEWELTRFLDPGSELTLIPRDPKHYCALHFS